MLDPHDPDVFNTIMDRIREDTEDMGEPAIFVVRFANEDRMIAWGKPSDEKDWEEFPEKLHVYRQRKDDEGIFDHQILRVDEFAWDHTNIDISDLEEEDDEEDDSEVEEAEEEDEYDRDLWWEDLEVRMVDPDVED